MTELERCDHKICETERLLREGHPDVVGLVRALADWSTERRLIVADMANRSSVN